MNSMQQALRVAQYHRQADNGHKPDPLDLCLRCDGRGQARETATQMRKEDDKLKTTALGSGCPVCHGTGRVAA